MIKHRYARLACVLGAVTLAFVSPAMAQPKEGEVKVATRPASKTPAKTPAILSLSEMEGKYTQWASKALSSGSNIKAEESGLKATLRSLRTFDAKQLGQGWIAHLALAAAVETDFATAVKDKGAQNPNFAKDLLSDPRKVSDIGGVEKAFLMALDKVSTDDHQYRFLSASYEASARGNPAPAADSFPKTALPHSISLVPYKSAAGSKDFSVMERVMSLAAVKVLEKEKEASLQSLIESMSQHRAVTSCLSLAQQNVDQCQAASRGKVDLSFCVAKHNLSETAACFAWILP